MEVSARERTVLIIALGLLASSIGGPVVADMLASGEPDVPIQGGVPLSSPSGPTVTLTQDMNVSLENPFPAADTVAVTSSEGNATISGGTGNITLASVTGPTEVVNASLGGQIVTVDPSDKPAVGASGGIDSWSYSGITPDDGTADISYSASSSGQLQIAGLSANTDYALIDANGDAIAKTTASGNGVVTADVPSGSYDIRVTETEFDAPVISDVRPTGRINSLPDTVYANVSDAEFGVGDNVTVTAVIVRADGTTRQLGSQSITSNQSVSFNVTSADKSFISTGENTLRVRAEDSYGVVSSVSKPFNVPGTLYIRSVDDADNVLNNTPVNVTFYGGGNNETVYETTVSDGAVNLSTLPVTTSFTVEVKAQNYTSRVVSLESIYRQQSVYMLDANKSLVEVRFELKDTTGSYPSESTLYIERAVTQNNTTAFKTVYSDTFGVEGVTTTLEDGVRYQLRVVAPDGDTAELGSYTATVAETVILRPDSPTVAIDGETDAVAYDAYVEKNDLHIEYQDPADLTEELTVTIHKRGEPNNLLRPKKTYYDLGNLSLNEPLGNKTSNWVVILEGNRGGSDFRARLTTGSTDDTTPVELDRKWRLAIAVFVLLVSAGIFSQANVGIGAIVVAIEGGVLWYTGWLSGVTTGATVALALLSAVVFNMATRR